MAMVNSDNDSSKINCWPYMAWNYKNKIRVNCLKLIKLERDNTV